MNDLVIITGDRVLADSRVLADRFGKQHKDVLRAIDRLVTSREDLRRNFTPMVYDYAAGDGGMKQARRFDIDQKGFSLLAMRFTGPAALDWQIRYVDAFEAMQAELLRLRTEGTPLIDRVPTMALGQPDPTNLAGIAMMITEHPELRGRLRWNAEQQLVEVDGEAMEPHHVTIFRTVMHRDGLKAGKRVVEDAMIAAARTTRH